MADELTLEDRFAGCLLAGACGDALGEPVKLQNEETIFQQYGPLGIRKPNLTVDGKATFTDDTQMTLFTAEGLISTVATFLQSGADLKNFRAQDALPGFHQSYLRWLATQKDYSEFPLFNEIKDKGMVVNQEGLRRRRGPGNTCLTSLSSGGVGTMYNRINNSKGCGGIMRIAPCGLVVHSAFSFLSRDEKADLAFKLGSVAAAVTHTHPSGWLSSASQAAIISRILSGDSIIRAIDRAIPLLKKEDDHDETLAKIVEAKELAKEFLKEFEDAGHDDVTDIARQKLVLKHLASLGQGWVGEETLGIALYCALITEKEKDVEHALCYSVNHGGDSDSTGAVTGNLVGALYGYTAIPWSWLENIEMKSLIEEVGADLLDLTVSSNPDNLLEKYPPPVTVHEGEEWYKSKEDLLGPSLKMRHRDRLSQWAKTKKGHLHW